MARPKLLQKQQAKYLYFTTPRTQNDICAAVGVAPKTLCHWIQKENWAEEKKKAYYSPEQLLHQLYEELREINTNITKREPGERFSTKEELEAKTKILALITNTIKNTHDHWRNLAPDFDLPVPAETKKEEPFSVGITRQGKKIGSIRMGEIPIRGKQPDGTFAHDERTAHEYYTRIALLLAAADEPFDWDKHKNKDKDKDKDTR